MIYLKKIFFLIILLIPIKLFALNASSYIVMDSDSLRVLEGSNIKEKHLIASTTKILTALITIENKNIHEKIKVSKDILKAYGSNIYIEINEELTIEDLLYGLLLRSGNDAAIELARINAGNMDNMAKMMNDYAKNIGMKDTNFINSSGLEDDSGNGNTSTSYDMALLMSKALQNETFRKIVSTKIYKTQSNFKSYVWHNKNKLLDSYEYCTGGKTGFTKKARRTLVTSASKDGKNLVVVTLNDPDDFTDHKSLYEKNFAKYNLVKLVDKDNFTIDKTIYDEVYLKNDVKVLLTLEEEKNVKISYDIFNKNDYQNDEVVGKVLIKLKDKVISSQNIYAKKEEEIDKDKSFWQKILDFLIFWN